MIIIIKDGKYLIYKRCCMFLLLYDCDIYVNKYLLILVENGFWNMVLFLIFFLDILFWFWFI